MKNLHQSKRRARSRQQQADYTRERVLAAAIELIDDKGEAGLRVVDVADRAGVVPGSIYTHFANRDELVMAARVEQYLAAVGTDVERIGAAVRDATDADDLVARMRSVSREASATDRADQRWRRAEILGAARRRPQLAARLGQSQHAVNQQLCAIAKVGQERGVLDPSLDPMALSLFVQAFTFGLLLADVDPETELDPDAWLDVVSRFTSAVTHRE